MKLVYISGPQLTDSDFQLIRYFQTHNVNVLYLIPLTDLTLRGGVLDLKNSNLKNGITRADSIGAMDPYKEYLDLKNVYFFKSKGNGGRKYISTWIMLYQVIKLIKSFKPDIIHLGIQLSHVWKLIYSLGIPIVGMVHDPIRHSSFTGMQEEKDRLMYFRKCSKLVLLSEVQQEAFCKTYAISKDKIIINKMGEFDWLRLVKPSKIDIKTDYILFFGQIQSHKGLEFLCEAFENIHKKHPEVHLVIAGKGDLYFDFEKYAHKDYFHLINEYITVPQLAGLLKKSLFCVCPYKDATQSGCVQTAFSANVPLIVTNVGALPKTVTDGKTGLVVPPCDVKALENALDTLLTDRNMLDDFKNNIESEWRPNMSWEPIGQKYISEYFKIKK